MKTFLNAILGSFLIVAMLGASLFIMGVLLTGIFWVIDYSPVLGVVLLFTFLIVFLILGSFARTREYFPGLKDVFQKREEEG